MIYRSPNSIGSLFLNCPIRRTVAVKIRNIYKKQHGARPWCSIYRPTDLLGIILFFGDAMYPLTLYLGVQRKWTAFFSFHMSSFCMFFFLSIWNKISICCVLSISLLTYLVLFYAAWRSLNDFFAKNRNKT
jgi:ABC-type transport system involved in cytochrome bd biosynthesis fused ATPase/permease subunit